MIRVILAGDHPVVRSGCLRLLEQAGDIRVVAVAGDGRAAYAACAEQVPDVLVADLDMPGGGLELIRHVCLNVPETRVLAIGLHDSPPAVAKALQAGALGGVSEADAPPCLLDAVRALYAGRRYLSPGLAPGLQPAEDECARALGLGPGTGSDDPTPTQGELADATPGPAAQSATDAAWTGTTPC